MQVCLIRCNSEFLVDDKVYPPLGLMSVGAGLRQQGHSVTIYDGDFSGIPTNHLYYGLGPTAPEYPYALSVLNYLREKNPKAKVIIGGPYATISTQEVKKDAWDCIVVGDGEIEAERSFTESKTIIFAKDLPLDSYPHPDRTLLDIHSYSYTLDGHLGTTLMTSRGCPFSCYFCCKQNEKVRLRSAESVIEEIKILQSDFGYNALGFPEDIFILNKLRTEKIASYLKQNSIIWRCLVRADILLQYGRDFTSMLADSGCVSIGIGIESGSDTILNQVGKGETTKTIRTAIAMLKSTGIKVKGFFILGLPGENESTLKETAQFLSEVDLDEIEIKIYQPYPGSKIYDQREQFDVHWTEGKLQDSFFKGHPGDYRGNLTTSKLTTKQIVEAWRSLDGL